MNKLSKERYLVALKRIRDLILKGRRLRYEDSEVIGDKYTTCSWGLCSHWLTEWPDSQDWARKPLKVSMSRNQNSERAVVLDIPEYCHCPMDQDQTSKRVEGCFYRCMIFQHKETLPTREEAIERYDSTIRSHK